MQMSIALPAALAAVLDIFGREFADILGRHGIVPFLRELPVRSSQWLVERNRGCAFGYIGAVFFVLPGMVFTTEILFSPAAPAAGFECGARMDDCERGD